MIERREDGTFDKMRRPLYYRLQQVYEESRTKWMALMDERPAQGWPDWLAQCDKRAIWSRAMLEASYGMREIERSK